MCSKTLNIRPQIEDELGQGGKDDRQHFPVKKYVFYAPIEHLPRLS